MLLTSMRRGDDPAEASLAAVRQAHLALTSLGSSAQAPSATYISATISGDAVTVCWLGDSRAYWLATDSEARRLTADDSLAEELVARGDLTEADAMASPQAHVITRWLGADVTDPQAHVVRFEPPGPGVVLICSDGLWNYRPDAEGLAKLALPAAFTDPLGAAGTLLAFALEAGGMDNITVVLAPFPLAGPGGAVLVPLLPGHLERGDRRGPRLLRQGARGHRNPRCRGRVPRSGRGPAVPAAGEPDADRAAERVPWPRA
jgi:hypothetical protein